MLDAKKLIRTAQNYFPGLAELKNDLYHLVRSRLHLAHERDFAVLGALPRRPDDLLLDVGGNRGQSILSMRKYRPETPIVCFEPSAPFHAGLLRRFGKDRHLEILNFGLGAEARELPLYIPSYRGFLYCGCASFHPDHVRNVLGPHTIYGFDPKHVSVQKLACVVKTLDSLELAPSFIKIDVEGFEYDVLRGGERTLRRHQPVLLFERRWTDRDIFPWLSGLGYREAVLRDGRIAPGRREEENALFMTERRLAECRDARAA